MTLIEKLRATQGDNAELCNVAADALANFSGQYCYGCKYRIDSQCTTGRGCVGWDWEDNNDSLQPHTEAPKKRELVFQDMCISEVPSFVHTIEQSNIQSISTYYLSDFYSKRAIVWYWRDM